MSLIQVEHVDKSFAGRHGSISIMQDISFDVKDSDFLAIVGPSGCGKSTLLRLIQGLDRPSAGRILFRDAPVTSVCSKMAMVFQSFALFPWLTVAQNVGFGLEALGWAPDRIHNQVERYISVTGLDGFQEAYPRELSGGMRQRVGLARALAVEPAVLLMDEPFSALDPLTAEGLREEVLQLWRDPELPPEAVLLVSHNIEEAIQLADRILVLSRRPAHLLAQVPVDLPRPRDRKSSAFYELTDRVYSLITEGGAASPAASASQSDAAARQAL
ncbi:MAG TPA: ABC transporter ATP-binding protein [Thermoplasmata archaeon]|nr:ABC transporter ATP-binding protein [Thermoplasmata archaeon]